MEHPARRHRDVSEILALGSFRMLCVLVAYAVAGPIVTDDFWFHLAMGRTYWEQGLWPAGDPMLHTALASAPVQHEWLFGVVVYGLERAFGFGGIRVVHLLAASATVLLAWSILRRESHRLVSTCLLTSVFLALVWFRLSQLRPDLVSIPAALLVYRLLIEPREPLSELRIAAYVALMLMWANLHSVFAIGILLPAAALASRWLLRLGLGRRAGRVAVADAGLGRLAAALALATLVTLINPRGVEQHLTFLLSSSHSAALAISDEWAWFNPFSWAKAQSAGSALTWIVADVVLAAFAWVAVKWALHVARNATFDPIAAGLFGLAAASTLAMVVAVRFLWLGIFPILFIVHVSTSLGLRPVGWRRWDRWAAVGSAAIVVALPFSANFRAFANTRPSGIAAYFASPYASEKYYLEGVRFLADTGVSGNLYNDYWMGSFIGYWLAPGLRTFIDGRTEHYPVEVLNEYQQIKRRRGLRPGESFLDVLQRRDVDLFFGTGIPNRAWKDPHQYTAAHLEEAPDWLLVSRGVRHAIYLNVHAGNREALDLIASYYQREGVPFSTEHGLDPLAVIRERPDWAASHGMLPRGWDRRIRDLESQGQASRFDTLDTLAICYASLGAYEAAIDAARRASIVRPDAKGPLRRIVYAALRLRRLGMAKRNAEMLERLDPSDPLPEAARRVLAQYAKRSGQRARPREADTARPAALLDAFPLLTPEETEKLRREFGWRDWAGNPT